PPGGELRVDARDHHLGVVGEQAAEALEIRRLVQVVQLLAEPRLELRGDLAGVDVLAREVARHGGEDPQERLHVLEILLHGGGDAGILHLDRDPLPARQLGAVDLAERRRRECLALDAAEAFLGWGAELRDEHPADARPGHRRHRGLHHGQDLERLAGEEVAPHAEHLRELHEGPAQLLRARDHPLGVPDVRLEQGPLVARRRLERALDRLPEVAAADRGREPPDRQHAARAPGGDVGHGRGPTRRYGVSLLLIRVAAAPAPNPLSMLTTTTPAAHVFSMPTSAASPPRCAPLPTLVGTAMTWPSTRPPTSRGSVPSRPATTISTAASPSRP